jgi:hypothetical protein
LPPPPRCLLLGGEVSADQDATFAAWQAALVAPNVFGLVVGRSLLFPADDDYMGAVDGAVSLLNAAGPTARDAQAHTDLEAKGLIR